MCAVFYCSHHLFQEVVGCHKLDRVGQEPSPQPVGGWHKGEGSSHVYETVMRRLCSE